MTPRKLFDLCWKYKALLNAHHQERNASCKLCHVKWMLGQMLMQGDYDFDYASMGKLNRWLGFIQGVFGARKCLQLMK